MLSRLGSGSAGGVEALTAWGFAKTFCASSSSSNAECVSSFLCLKAGGVDFEQIFDDHHNLRRTRVQRCLSPFRHQPDCTKNSALNDSELFLLHRVHLLEG